MVGAALQRIHFLSSVVVAGHRPHLTQQHEALGSPPAIHKAEGCLWTTLSPLQADAEDLKTQEAKAPGCIIASYPFQIRGDLVSSQTRCIGSLTRMSKSILSTSTLQTAQPPAKRERRGTCLLASAEVPTPPHPQPPPQQLAQS